MAKPLSRRILKFVFVTITVAVMITYVLGCIAPYANTNTYWYLGFASLAFPYAGTALALFCIFWFIAKPKFAWFTLLILLLGYAPLLHIIGFKWNSDFKEAKSTNTLRIVSWNVQSFNGLSTNKEARKLAKTEIEHSITKYNPDVICLQEFNTNITKENTADHIALFNKLYPYHFFSADYQRKKGSYQSGCIIFSKYPFAQTKKIKYPVAESLIYADIVKGKDTIRIYTTHLQSFKFGKEDYDEIDHLSANDASELASMSFLKKMKLAFKRRSAQANIVQAEIAKTTYPSILCADFNDVP
ncbi:MAG: endonuclease/exonuclease/phosphatase family protein, partial [Chitinophagaceae bacterium]|nr:endonuclease/exonuclease/phosphatase family protein [Chitinophagaceae bacterium]